MSILLEADSRQQILTELSYAIDQRTLVDARITPTGISSVSHLTRTGHVVRVVFDPDETVGARHGVAS